MHSIYDQPDAESVHAQFDRVVDALHDKLPAVADHLEAARADILAFTVFPKEVWWQNWSDNPTTTQPRDPPPHGLNHNNDGSALVHHVTGLDRPSSRR